MIDNLEYAIVHAKEVARELKSSLSDFPRECFTQSEIDEIVRQVQEHEKLAEWLTELAERREADRWNVIRTEADLPKEEGDYLVDCKERKLSIQHFFFSIADHRPYWSGMCKVYAWQPLPKSYTESEDK